MEKIAFSFGFIKIHWYSIFIFIAILAAYFVISKEAKKKEIDKEFITNLTFYVVVIGIIGARIYYCLFNLDYYLANPLEILKIWNGGLAIHGGILFGGIFTIIYIKMHRLELLKTLDIIVVGIILAQAIGRWGNFFNSEAYGGITTLKSLQNMHIPSFIINGMYISGKYRQPTFLYESVWNLIGFIVLLIFRRRKYTKVGQTTGLYFMWYSVGRFIIEGMRSDSLMLGSFKIAQLMSVLLFIEGLLLFIYYKVIKKESRFDHLYREEKRIEKEKQPLFIKQ